jgi:hypothetical protein
MRVFCRPVWNQIHLAFVEAKSIAESSVGSEQEREMLRMNLNGQSHLSLRE